MEICIKIDGYLNIALHGNYCCMHMHEVTDGILLGVCECVL